jgi:Uma2 family endonuclease
MALLIETAWLPATITHPPTLGKTISDAEFAAFCGEHPDLSFEMTADGELLIMPPTYGVTGRRNIKILSQLDRWSGADERGGATDSSTGFVLPNGARRSPDAAWTSNERLAAMPPGMIEGYWHLCPNFVVELRSGTDRLPVLRAKMREWLDNGAELGWLIDPQRRAVEIFRPDREPEILVDIDRVPGEGPVAGFVLELDRIWQPRGI